MKKFVLFTIILVVAAVPFFGLAADFRMGDQASVRAGEHVNDIYITGGGVTIIGTVAGDVLAAGGNVLINGGVGADVNAAGGSITVTSDVGDDVRVAGGNIIIQGAVGGDVFAGGGQITISSSRVGGDVTVGGGTIRIDAPVAGTIRAGGGQVYINGPVAGNVIVKADKLTLGSAAVIEGNLTYTAKNEAILEGGAVIKGKTEYTSRPQMRHNAGKAAAALFSLWLLWKFFALLTCSFVLAFIFRRYASELTGRVWAHPLHEMGRGFIVFVVFPAASIALLISLIGIPLGLLGLIAFAGSLIFAWIASPIVFGSFAYRQFFKRDRYEITWKTILLGVALYVLIGLIPLIGKLLQLALLFATLGAALKIKWELVKAWRHRDMAESKPMMPASSLDE